ncbi:hypothetical protein NHF46_21520 [Arthrobacter alpinus]|nr:hypothetical protein [Arthrobacter alpinus]
MKIIIGIAVAAVAVTVVLLFTGSLSGETAAWIIGSIVLVWLITTLIVFTRGQRELFRLLNARATMLEQDEINRQNLRHILRDLRRLGDTYSQFLAWSHVIGNVLHEPFGRAPAAGTAKEVYVQGLPLNVKVGSAAISSQNISRAAAQLRQGIFSTGWLSQSWQTAINGAPAQLGTAALRFQAMWKPSSASRVTATPPCFLYGSPHSIKMASVTQPATTSGNVFSMSCRRRVRISPNP